MDDESRFDELICELAGVQTPEQREAELKAWRRKLKEEIKQEVIKELRAQMYGGPVYPMNISGVIPLTEGTGIEDFQNLPTIVSGLPDGDI